MNNLKSKFIFSREFPQFKGRISLPQLILVGLLSLAIAVTAIPNYLSRQPSWADLPQVSEIKRLEALQKQPLNFPGWQTLEQSEIRIGGNQWSVQAIERGEFQKAVVFLMPQDYYRNHPQVEWVDLNGIERWKTDSHKVLPFESAEQSDHPVSARFFRAWNAQTFVVVQWYAWPGGGNFAPAQWFWADQWAQLHRQRVPWIAVSLKMPIDPLGDLAKAEADIKSLAQTVQTTLNRDVFEAKALQNDVEYHTR